MSPLSMSETVLIVCLSVFTAVAAITDWRTHRIPNALAVSAFPHADTLAGSLLDAAKAFAVGFGTLFVLWLVGGGGGGDAKMMGALSVWLGWKMTLAVLILSTLFVVLGSLVIVMGSLAARALRGKRLLAAELREGVRHGNLAVAAKPGRRIMTFGVPVALATWVVVFWFHWKAHAG
jgi:prepilin peptidase CpaA